MAGVRVLRQVHWTPAGVILSCALSGISGAKNKKQNYVLISRKGNGFIQGFSVGSSIWLAAWSTDPLASTDTAVRDKYLAIYGVLGLLQVISHKKIKKIPTFFNYSLPS